MKVVDAQYDANAAVWIRVIHDGAVLGSSDRQRKGLWITVEEKIWSKVAIGEFFPTLGVYPSFGRLGITAGR